MHWPLSKGEETTRRALARIVGYEDDTPLKRGMVKPQSGPHTDKILLFHDPEDNPYGDVIEGDMIAYVGQGQAGHQRFSAQNQYLAEHLKRNLTVHFFVKESPGRFLYEGEVICQGYERVYRSEEGRSVLEFSLVRADALDDLMDEPLAMYQHVREEIHREGEPRLVDRRSRISRAQRIIRDVAFRDAILQTYKRTCAVCGPPLTRDHFVDLEAAHIVGVAERGPDHRRNGISLCHRHHWAFDHGIFTLSDDLRVQLLMDHEDPHGEIIEGDNIMIPSNPRLTPHMEFLAMHRAKWATG